MVPLDCTGDVEVYILPEQPWMWNAEGRLKFIYFPQGGIVELEEGAEIGTTYIEVVAFIGICNEMNSGAAASGRGRAARPTR
jgi:hypothetical protein